MKKTIVNDSIKRIMEEVPFEGDAAKKFKAFISKELNFLEHDLSELDKEWCKNKTTSLRIDDLELKLATSWGTEPKQYWEIVKWMTHGLKEDQKESHYTILTFKESSDDDADIVFVGSRPFDDGINYDDLWLLMSEGQKIATSYYKIMQETIR